jgi:uncharacterized heparinase superfamily protein
MIFGRLDRLRRMTLEEGRWRVRERTRRLGDRVRFRLRTPGWERPRDSRVADAVIERLSRGKSHCVIDPELAESVRQQILMQWPDAAADATARADRILAGHYDVLGYRGLQFADWHSDPVHHRGAPRVCWTEVPYLDPTVGDHKIIWELNRHQHWLQLGRALWLTGDARYGSEIVRQFENWLEDNPPLTGINWASMLEIGFRTISWTMAAHFLAGAGCQLPLGRFVAAIDRQLTHVEHHLSYYFSPNTHLTGEALALYVVGQAFPELPASQRWVTTGRRILLREIDRQILPDGGHAERSMHYQRYTLDFYLLALLTARRTADFDAARAFASAATRAAEFTQVIADDEGRLPLIGDDDGGMLWPITGRECTDVRDSLAVAAVTLDRPDLAPWGIAEEAFWVAPSEAMRFFADLERSAALSISADAARTFQRPRSTTFADTGYVILRDGDGGHAVFDAGVHGYLNGGHAHADALSLTLRIGNRSFLVDPGTSTYTLDPQLRDWMRGSFNHNTVSIDGRPQSTPAGPFHWKTTADGNLAASRHSEGFDWAEAIHDGYAPIEHRRSIVRANAAGWLVVDEVCGAQNDPHSAATHWHFDPAWMVRSEGNRRLRATHLEGNDAWLLCDAGDVALLHGDEQSGLGWYAPVYGTLVPTWTARFTRTGRLPFSIITWIGETPDANAPVLERLAVNADSTGEAIGARIICGEFVSTYLIRPGEPSFRDSRASGIQDYQTNARVLHLRTRGKRLVALDIVDASHALALRDGLLSVAADEPIRDLHARVANGVLHLTTSEPPRQLRVEGHGFALLISGSNWTSSPSWPLFHFGAPFALEEVAPERCEEILPLRESSW